MTTSTPDEADVELRFNVPRWVVDVIDARVQAGIGRQTSRNKISIAVMSTWARDQIHLATIVSRVTRGNGNGTPSDWGDLGDLTGSAQP